jgi:hypothetical protein
MYYDQDDAGGRAAPVFETGPGGFSVEFNTTVIIQDASTRTEWQAGYDGVSWTLLAFGTGLSI